MKLVSTLGELRSQGYVCRPVKEELRENLIEKLSRGEPIFPGIIGYDDTVVPQIVNAILSRHDLLLLGLRGQAKTRLIRSLPLLLDEWVPTFADGDIPDDPIHPRLARHRHLVESQGDDVAIRWIHRDDRFHEKLATPDVTIADLIGEIDIVKHAEGHRLDDEGVLHFGLIPRTNRGIFAINELPDLAPKIQVGLFNALEERDVQIRGFPVRLPLDTMMAFTANPEDYTNRGRIVTPLKDRIGSVVRTHYPLDTNAAIRITQDNAWVSRGTDGRRVDIPRFMLEIVESIARLARESAHINQLSGVSVRMSIANAELMVSNAERRSIAHNEKLVVPRISDLTFLTAGCRGKIELMLADDERAEDKLIGSLIGEAVKSVFEDYFDPSTFESVVEAFANREMSIESGDGISTSDFVAQLAGDSALQRAAVEVCERCGVPGDDAAYLATAGEFILESLFVNNRLSKYAYHGKTMFKR